MKGMMYKEELFREVIAGRKDQTRRIVPISHPINREPDNWECVNNYCFGTHKSNFRHKESGKMLAIAPTYLIDTVVYLKEPFTYRHKYDRYYYKFDYYKFGEQCEWERDGEMIIGDPYCYDKWHNKMFMPAKAARYFIRISNVRVERVAGISFRDIMAETGKIDFHVDPHWYWKSLWNRINSKWKRIGDEFFAFPYDKTTQLKLSDRRDRHVIANPWVFAYDFALCDREGSSIQPLRHATGNQLINV